MNNIYSKFSVAMSVYKNDCPEYLSQALNSILINQTVVPDEVILIIDGPIPDKLDDLILSYESNFSSLNVVRFPENKGLGFALREAVLLSRNSLIARMDSDDISYPTRFEEQLKMFKKFPDIDIVGGNISEFIDEENNIVATRTVPLSDSEIKNYLKSRCPFNHVSVMFKKEAIVSAGNYEEIFWNEDYFLWIRMYEKGCLMCNTGTTLVNVRVGYDMYSRRGGRKYFKSEYFIQRYMKERKIISPFTFYKNCTLRFILQILLSSNIRGWVYRNFARS